MTASVTFGSGETERMLTLTAADDAVDEEEETVTLGFGTLPERVTPGTQNTAILTLTDNDDRGVTVSPTKLEVTEGCSETYTVVLGSQPTGEVTVAVNVPEGAEFTVEAEELTFAVGAWETAQTVTVKAGRDDDAVAAAAASIEHDGERRRLHGRGGSRGGGDGVGGRRGERGADAGVRGADAHRHGQQRRGDAGGRAELRGERPEQRQRAAE